MNVQNLCSRIYIRISNYPHTLTRMLRKALGDLLTEQEGDQLFSAFDQIGSIIVIRIPDSLLAKKNKIGETLLKQVKTVQSVYYQSSSVDGNFRTRKLELLAGKDSTETEYKEHGCRFTVDVEKAFFSPRLSTERLRIANLVRSGDTILNMFAGIGMFSVVAAKNKKCTVYSIDVNPIASRLCEKNISQNKLTGKIIPINGDAAKIIEDRLTDTATRTLMLLPERSYEFLNSAITATKNGGIIHYYTHTHAEKKQDAPKTAEEHFENTCSIPHTILASRNVRAVGPRYYQTVVDAQIFK